MDGTVREDPDLESDLSDGQSHLRQFSFLLKAGTGDLEEFSATVPDCPRLLRLCARRRLSRRTAHARHNGREQWEVPRG